jgi:hypothetical protein
MCENDAGDTYNNHGNILEDGDPLTDAVTGK